jgi:hypothetical protein
VLNANIIVKQTHVTSSDAAPHRLNRDAVPRVSRRIFIDELIGLRSTGMDWNGVRNRRFQIK